MAGFLDGLGRRSPLDELSMRLRQIHLPHVSRFEQLLEPPDYFLDERMNGRDEKYDTHRPHRIIKSMLHSRHLLRMRSVSKCVRRWVDQDLLTRAELFETLYVTRSMRGRTREKSLAALATVGVYCRQLVIRLREGTEIPGEIFADISPSSLQQDLGELDISQQSAQPRQSAQRPTLASNRSGKTPSNTLDFPRSARDDPDQYVSLFGTSAPSDTPFFGAPAPLHLLHFPPTHESDWSLILKRVQAVNTICISAKGIRGWGTLSQFESTIISIRVAIESSWLHSFTTLRLEPIHAFGLLHCRWDGGTAFFQSAWTARAIWQRITTLEVQVLNPFEDMSQSQIQTFEKALHSWLASYARRLQVLRFHWVGGSGPNPLLLGLEYPGHDFDFPRIYWDQLRELWLGNAPLLPAAYEELSSCAPLLRKLFVLRDDDFYEEPEALANFDHHPDWVDRTFDLKLAHVQERLRAEQQMRGEPSSPDKSKGAAIADAITIPGGGSSVDRTLYDGDDGGDARLREQGGKAEDRREMERTSSSRSSAGELELFGPAGVSLGNTPR